MVQAAAERSPGLKDCPEMTGHIFKLCDRVKYAKHIPDESQKNAALEDSFTLVETVREALKPIEEPAKTEGESL